jgi:hypothetical protein
MFATNQPISTSSQDLIDRENQSLQHFTVIAKGDLVLLELPEVSDRIIYSDRFSPIITQL